ncbi:MAG: rhomboid family intramembrane serine protease [Alphaproteobacteria bacterium]|nr:rhomboid family intramembrane serine protease [Alphaproteobacteria bacterium]
MKRGLTDLAGPSAGGGEGSPYRLRPEPVFNVPGLVVVLIALMWGIFLVEQVLPIEARVWMLLHFSFIPAALSLFGQLDPASQVAVLASLVTHTFLHAGFLHVGFNSLWLLAFGSYMVRRQRAHEFLALYFLSGIGGALAFYATEPGSEVPVVGASGAISGLMGAAARLFFLPGVRIFGSDAVAPQLLSVTDRRVVAFTLVWTGINVLFGLAGGFGLAGEGVSIAWAAHLGGYFTGLFAVPFFLRRRLVV